MTRDPSDKTLDCRHERGHADVTTGRPWLEEYWQAKRNRTLERVRRAIGWLESNQQPVSIRSIMRASEQLDGEPLSANAIARNAQAHELYVQHRTARRSGAHRRNRFLDYLNALDAPSRDAAKRKLRRLSTQTKADLALRAVTLEIVCDDHERTIAGLQQKLLTAMKRPR